jgi:tRNA(Ile)-lysidine synthase
MNPFEASVAAALGNDSRGRVFLAAVSGGADSTAMLCALAVLRREMGFTLYCLHVDHGIRPEAERRGDGEFTAELCEKRGIPCRIAVIPPGRIAGAAKRLGSGLEAAARIYRRRAWNREARRIVADAILVAHTRDDLLETALMRILRGVGPAGLAAMPARRGRILRPLLELDRAGVLRYLAEKNVPHRIDSSNGDNRFFRNALRNRLIPLLDELSPRWRGALQNMAETQRLAADFLAAEAAGRIRWETAGDGRELRTGAADFFALPPILREEALFRGIDLLCRSGGLPRRRGRNIRPVKRSNIRKFSGGDRAALDLGPCRVRKGPAQVILSAAGGKSREAGFSLLIKAPGLYKLGGVTFELFRAFNNKDRETAGPGFFVSLPLILRRAFSGDRILRGGGCSGAGVLKAGQTGVLCAADASGPAAFIGLESPGGAALLSVREPPPEMKKDGSLAGWYYCQLDGFNNPVGY